MTLGITILYKNSQDEIMDKTDTSVRKLPNLTGLKAFDAVCRTGSVTSAAHNLQVTPGAVSRQVSQLEDALGCSLFGRRGKRLTLTEVGETYKEEVYKALDTIEKASQAVMATAHDNHLIISCSPSFHFCWLLARLPTFEALHNDITVVIHTKLSTHAQNVPVDAVIGVGEWPDDASMIQTKFMGNYSCPVMAPHILNNVDVQPNILPLFVRLLTLRKQPHIWNDWCRAAGVPSLENTVATEMDHMFLTIEAAKAGLGAAIAPYSYVAKDIEEGRLVAPFNFLERDVPYHIAWPASQTPKSGLKKFTAWLKKEGNKTPTPR